LEIVGKVYASGDSSRSERDRITNTTRMLGDKVRKEKATRLQKHEESEKKRQKFCDKADKYCKRDGTQWWERSNPMQTMQTLPNKWTKDQQDWFKRYRDIEYWSKPDAKRTKARYRKIQLDFFRRYMASKRSLKALKASIGKQESVWEKRADVAMKGVIATSTPRTRRLAAKKAAAAIAAIPKEKKTRVAKKAKKALDAILVEEDKSDATDAVAATFAAASTKVEPVSKPTSVGTAQVWPKITKFKGAEARAPEDLPWEYTAPNPRKKSATELSLAKSKKYEKMRDENEAMEKRIKKMEKETFGREITKFPLVKNPPEISTFIVVVNGVVGISTTGCFSAIGRKISQQMAPENQVGKFVADFGVPAISIPMVSMLYDWVGVNPAYEKSYRYTSWIVLGINALTRLTSTVLSQIIPIPVAASESAPTAAPVPVAGAYVPGIN